MNESYGSVSETIDGFKKEGYTLDFNINKECIVCQKTNTVLSPDDFEIDKVFRLKVFPILMTKQ